MRLSTCDGIHAPLPYSLPGRAAAAKASLDAFIVERVADAIKALQPHANDLQRQQYGTLLAAVAPPRVEGGGHGSHEGRIAPIAARLGVPCGGRAGGRQFAFDAAVDRRMVFDDRVRALPDPSVPRFSVGDRVLCRGAVGE
eukprot:6177185-Pleurochrysis_carterae.AAC.1